MQSLVFLGININTRAKLLSLDSVKKSALIDRTMQQTRLSKSQLQTLADKLAWASIATPWGKTHLCFLQAFFKTKQTFEQASEHIYTTKHSLVA